MNSWAWWLTPVIPAPGGRRQEMVPGSSQPGLSSSRTACATEQDSILFISLIISAPPR